LEDPRIPQMRVLRNAIFHGPSSTKLVGYGHPGDR
jgi:hypothetical protein